MNRDIQYELLKSNKKYSFIEAVNFAAKLEEINAQLDSSASIDNHVNSISRKLEKIEEDKSGSAIQAGGNYEVLDEDKSYCKYKYKHRCCEFIPDTSNRNNKLCHKNDTKIKINKISSRKNIRQILTEAMCHGEITCLFVDCGSAISLVSPRLISKLNLIHEIKSTKIRQKKTMKILKIWL